MVEGKLCERAVSDRIVCERVVCGNVVRERTVCKKVVCERCVCVYHLNRCKTSLFFFFLLSSPFLITQGRAAPLAYCAQRSYCHWWDGEADHLPVPAEFSLSR